jgi:competence protein ComEC
MFLMGILEMSTGSMLPALVALALYIYSAPQKESGLRRVLFAAGLPLFFALGIVCFYRADNEREQYLSKITEDQTVLLSGKVRRIEEKTRCFYYYLTDCTIRLSGEAVPCDTVLAYVPADEYSIGEILVIKGKISFFETAKNEGGFDEKAYYASQRIDFALDAKEIEVAEAPYIRYPDLLWQIRKRLREVLKEAADDDGVLSAMLLGDKAELDTDIKSLYKKAGISHILAISGLHVSLLGMGLYRLLRKRLKRTQLFSALMTAFLVLSYGCMTGNAVSTRRAVIMLLIYLLADVIGRAYDLLSALGLAVIFLLWENPFLTGYTGFLFSAAAVLGIGVAGQIMKTFKTAKHPKTDGIFISLAIQLFTLPLVARYYFEIPVYALCINFVVLGLIGPVLTLAFLGTVLGLLSIKIAKFLLAPCVMVLNLYQWLCERVLSLPGAQIIVGKPEILQMGIYYFLLGTVLFAIWICGRRAERLSARGEEKEKKAVVCRKICGVLTTACALCLCFTVLFFPKKREFEVDVLDVGQGDGIYLCTGDGVSMFIDGGSSSVSAVGTYRILPFLKSRGIRSISYWFVSHGDSDHISGLYEVIESGYRIENLVVAKAARDNEKIAALILAAKEAGIKTVYMQEGDRIKTGTGKLTCLYPAAEDDTGEEDDTNDLSLVLKFTDSGKCAIFAGDISEDVEKILTERGKCTEVDFFKANHHGSRYSNSEEFLAIISPLVTVASAGEGNLYGHPSPFAVERIKDSGSEFYCTIDYGQLLWDGTGLKSP